MPLLSDELFQSTALRTPALVCVALGSVGRYVLAAWADRWAAALFGWGWGTLVVNVLGCALAGVLGGAFAMLGRGVEVAVLENLRLLLIVGFLGIYDVFGF